MSLNIKTETFSTEEELHCVRSRAMGFAQTSLVSREQRSPAALALALLRSPQPQPPWRAH